MLYFKVNLILMKKYKNFYEILSQLSEGGITTKLDHLFLLKEAVKYSSISLAAEKNFVSQSTVSAAIINLEKELGVELLIRTNTGVVSTKIGEQVLKKVDAIFLKISEIQEIAQKKMNTGQVNLSGIPCICNGLIPETMQHLKQIENTEIELIVKTDESSKIVHDVSSGIVNLGILINYRELERVANIHYQPLFHDSYILFVGKKSPLWGKESVSYDEILQQPYIAYRDEFKTYNGGLTNVLENNPLPKIMFRTDSLDAMKSMIVSGPYVAFFPSRMSEEDFYVKYKLIQRLPIKDKNLEFEVGYIENKNHKLNNLEQIVLEAFKRTVKAKKNTDLKKRKESDFY
jgi:DNA-binding transcriptional LysR family regulator